MYLPCRCSTVWGSPFQLTYNFLLNNICVGLTVVPDIIVKSLMYYIKF